ncbi:hypothetical protein [Kitasatospora cineracea]
MDTAEGQAASPEVQEIQAEELQEIGLKFLGVLANYPEDLDQFPEPA